MPITRRRFVLNSIGSAVAAPSLLALLTPPESSSAAPNLTGPRFTGPKPYGSGHFGDWISDEHGLPAYRYTCEQLTDPKAVTDLTPGMLAQREHVWQVGNDRITAIVSNSGTVRVRQDEGSPKFLNDYLPESHQYAGGFGYLTDGQETLSTLYAGDPAKFERIFGVGYAQKRVTGKNLRAEQTLIAPFGDDPVLISQVTLRNTGQSAANVRWVEYWGCRNYQFSFRSFVEGITGRANAVEMRRHLAERFESSIEPIPGGHGLGAHGLIEKKKFLGRTPQEEGLWKGVTGYLAGNQNNFISALHDAAPGAAFDDLQPPATFLVSLDAPADGFSANGKSFFGAGGAQNPAGLGGPLDGSLKTDDSKADEGWGALLLERRVHLKPGESATLHFLYGYLPAGFDLDALIARYAHAAPTTLNDTCAAWKSHGMRFSVESEPWVARETLWNYYSLRSSMTYDAFFQEHLLNQNGFYQYVMGFQGAARDPLQHSLPFLFSDPEIVKSILRYTLKEVRADGSVPYAIAGHGIVAPMTADNACDLPLWLLWATSEYVLATRDTGFLQETIPAPLAVPAHSPDTVLNLLAHCFRHQVEQVGVGEHGVSRMLKDDWNDGLVDTFAASAEKECVAQGESVLNSAMSAWVFDYYARMLSFAGESADSIPQIRKQADAHRQAAAKQWTGKWLRRCWLGPTLGWLGNDTLWIEPQPWAILAGVTTPEQSRALVRTMDELLRRDSPIGAMQLSRGPDMQQGEVFEPGTCVNGGVWPSLNQTLVWALAGIDPAMAWDEWKKNSLARHAETYPDLWYGIWSGTDSWNADWHRQRGESVNNRYFHGTDMPVLNLHAHACSLYSITKLLGLDFTPEGLRLNPDLPIGRYRFESPLLGVIRSETGFEGWYAPLQPGRWSIEIALKPETGRRHHHFEINGKATEAKPGADGTIVLRGESSPGNPLRWRIA